jgi:hypothetical protein
MSFTKKRYFSRPDRAITLSADTLGGLVLGEGAKRRRLKRYRDSSREIAEGQRVYDRYDWKSVPPMRPNKPLRGRSSRRYPCYEWGCQWRVLISKGHMSFRNCISEQSNTRLSVKSADWRRESHAV